MSAINYNLQDTSQPIVETVNRILPRIPIAILVLLVGILIIKLLSHIIRISLSVTSLPKGLQGVISGLTDVALWIFLAIALLQAMGLNNVALAVTGSFAFVVLGLSQGGAAAVADVISGLTLSRDRDYNVGDKVKIDKESGGVIEEIDLRHTRLRDDEGKMHIIPNALVDKNGWILIERGKLPAHPTRKLKLRRK